MNSRAPSGVDLNNKGVSISIKGGRILFSSSSLQTLRASDRNRSASRMLRSDRICKCLCSAGNTVSGVIIISLENSFNSQISVKLISRLSIFSAVRLSRSAIPPLLLFLAWTVPRIATGLLLAKDFNCW